MKLQIVATLLLNTIRNKEEEKENRAHFEVIAVAIKHQVAGIFLNILDAYHIKIEQ